jgi:hypothetical protein
VGHSLLAHRNPKVAAVQAVRVLFEGQTNNEKKKNEQKRSHSALLHQWVCAQALMVRQVLLHHAIEQLCGRRCRL